MGTIKCPRCEIPQEHGDICKYCDFDMRTVQPASAETGSYRKMAGLLMLVFFLIVTASLHFFQKQNEEKKRTAPSRSSGVIPEMSIPQNIPELNQLMKGVAAGGGFSGGGIITSIFFSMIGMGYFSYGKKRHQQSVLFTGIMLMAYTYFIQDTLMMTVIGVELCFLPLILTLIFE